MWNRKPKMKASQEKKRNNGGILMGSRCEKSETGRKGTGGVEKTVDWERRGLKDLMPKVQTKMEYDRENNC